MKNKEFFKISGLKNDFRIPSRVLEEMVQTDIQKGYRNIEVDAYGQHGIGGRLWGAPDEQLHIRITGQSGQRAGSLGFANTLIEIMGPASDDIGWLNAGAQIIVHGNASNGVMNGAAQGKVYIAGHIGARGMTMTKHNPRFEAPELWVLKSAGDYFGEFMAGGTAVICGFQSEKGDNILGHRPFVGMVGGKALVRGDIVEYSEKDAKIVPLSDEDWEWLVNNLELFLEKIDKKNLIKEFSNRSDWNVIKARTPQEKTLEKSQTSMSDFIDKVWEKELGKGGLIGDLQEIQKEAIPLITKGDLRRFIPVWEQNIYKAPCQAACPIGIPIPERWSMIRSQKKDEAINIGLLHTPFPATVCGYLCPSPCMASCTKTNEQMPPIDMNLIGKEAKSPTIRAISKKSKKKIAVLGGGPAGISAAWHLTLKGHNVVIFDKNKDIGGKILSLIPESRIPKNVLKNELERVKEFISDIKYEQKLTKDSFSKIKYDYDFTIIASGADKPRSLNLPGIEKALLANDFLEKAKTGKTKASLKDKTIVIIGAGNVGCDVATEAHRFGAKKITLIDVQKPAAFGKEKEDALKIGAKFKWPCFTKEITSKGIILDDDELLKADKVVISIGDSPDLDFIDKDIDVENNFIVTDEFYQTSDKRVFAIGDVVLPGLLTDAIGAGKKAAFAINSIIKGKPPKFDDDRTRIDTQRISLAYFNPRGKLSSLEECGQNCASCGQCRDCGICEATCPEQAIYRVEMQNLFAYKSDPDKCIGCGFCMGACPCGIWDLLPNEPF